MTKVILISGKQGSGKTTLSQYLLKAINRQKCFYAISLKFADPLYQMHDYCLAVLNSAGIETLRKDGKLLQLLGTEWGRSIDKDIWVKVAQSKVKKLKPTGPDQIRIAIIDDTRFKNELEAFPDAIKIRLECNKDTRRQRTDSWRDNEMHPSEIDLDDWVYEPGRFDFIFNTGVQPVEMYARMIIEKLKTECS